jgi:hypothetical protein
MSMRDMSRESLDHDSPARENCIETYLKKRHHNIDNGKFLSCLDQLRVVVLVELEVVGASQSLELPQLVRLHPTHRYSRKAYLDSML